MEMKITWSTLAKQQLKDDFRTNLFARGRQGSRKISYNIKFRQVFLNQYPGKNTLKAIINKVAPMGERNDFRNEFHGFFRPVRSFFFFCLVVSIKKCIFAAIKMFF